MEKTVKLHAYTDDAKRESPQGNLTDEQNRSFELAKKSALLEDEKKRSLEHLQTIEQLRASLKQEQEKSAEQRKKFSGLETQELAKKNALLDEEKRKSQELLKIVEQLRESLGQEQAKTLMLEKKAAEADAGELAKRNALIDGEKKRALELQQANEQLRDSLKQAQDKALESANKAAAQEAKVKELGEVLSKISAISSLAKTL